jgi:hypothetical protein
MKSNFRWAPIIIGIPISLGISIPIFFGPQHQLAALPTPLNKARPKLKVRGQPPPPPSRGFPATGKAAISRGQCFNTGAKLVALAPQFVQKGLNNGGIDEQSVWGQTTMEYPTVWFFVPFTDRSTQLEFFLQNRSKDVIYQSIVQTPAKDGIIGVKIPRSQKLFDLSKHYRWTLKATVSCGGSSPEKKFVNGWIQRVSLPAGIDMSINPTQVYVDRGIWYDAVTSLAQQRLQEPNNDQLKQDWKDLLGATNLEEISGQLLLK